MCDLIQGQPLFVFNAESVKLKDKLNDKNHIKCVQAVMDYMLPEHGL